MATIAVYYDPKERIRLDHSHMPPGIALAMLSIEEPRDKARLEGIVRHVARLLLTQVKAA